MVEVERAIVEAECLDAGQIVGAILAEFVAHHNVAIGLALDGVARGGADEARDIMLRASVNVVVAGPADQGVVASSAFQIVVAGASVENIGTCVSGEFVVRP